MKKDLWGPSNYGSRNERGNKLINFCQENNLKIVNSYFKKRAGRKWTWLYTNGYNKSEIDYIC